jgi:hypothetical protein
MPPSITESDCLKLGILIMCRPRHLLHAKFMYELCSLLMYILTCLDVMRCYNHVLYWFMEIFHRFLLFWLWLCRIGIPCFAYFDVLRIFLNSNWLRIFYSINILSREASGEQEVKEEGHEAQPSTGGAGSYLGRVSAPQMLKWASWLRCHPSLS